MSARIEGSHRTTRTDNDGGVSSKKGPNAIKQGSPSLGDPNVDLDDAAGLAAMGIEGLAAMLQTESAKTTQKVARECEKAAKEQQIASLNKQVDELHQKASDIRSEAIVSGSLAAASGALTIASVAAGPSPADKQMAAGLRRQASAPGASQWSSMAADRADAINAGATARATVFQASGKTAGDLGAPLGKLTYGARQVEDDANATKAATEAKNAESARDEWNALSKQAQQSIEKAQQALQSIVAERTAVRRSILR